MTEEQLKAILRPHLRRVIRAARRGWVPVGSATSHFSEGGVDDDPVHAWGFRPEDADRFSDFFADDGDGFPPDLHLAFSLNRQEFARRTGLRERADGRWVYPRAPREPEPATFSEGASPSDQDMRDLRIDLIFKATGRGDEDLAKRLAVMSPEQVWAKYQQCRCSKK